ncbi:ABC transporter permease subunit [Thermanaerothrix sp.]|uniref:ABC transporter permease subunit n=1 Tax=Thermanaerothrix sp. TaxID=2972675 RepID=UPI002ADE478D|nr:ABC transporter permease subunit [Thermanaerothrix sp.]
MILERFKRWLGSLPVHVVLLGLCFIWLLPTLGLLVTSFRPFQDVNETGWWQVFDPPKGAREYQQFCAACHGDHGNALPNADLSNPELVQRYRRSFTLMAALSQEINGQPHLGETPLPNENQAALIATYLRRLSGIEVRPRFTLDNYIDAIVGYRGTRNYRTDCAEGVQSVDLYCDWRDLGNPRGMGRALLNSLIVTIPATILPILVAAFAAYAFSWMEFPGRQWLFALLVGVQIVPLQMALIPVSRLYAQLGLNGTFPGIWMFHTGFGLPYAIFLTRNFMGSLPRELFESAFLDGASHWTVFTRLAIPLTVPAIASLAIFQFLWVWNDLLVALVFLGGTKPVLTYQISNLVTSLGGGWHLLTAAAFISMILPMIVFFAFQRYFIRGLLAGSIKG